VREARGEQGRAGERDKKDKERHREVFVSWLKIAFYL